MGPGVRRDDGERERFVTQPLLIEHDDGVDRVTLNRPESLNALDPSLIDALNLYFQGLQRNRDTRVVVLKGAGANFCAGLDLKQAMARRGGQSELPGVTESLDSQRRIADIVMLMRRCPQPIIALVQGAAAGGGFALALAADIRIAANNARMNCAFIKLGLGGCDIGTSYFLPRLVGVSVASELILTGRFIQAERALAVGLVSEVVDAADLEGFRITADRVRTTLVPRGPDAEPGIHHVMNSNLLVEEPGVPGNVVIQVEEVRWSKPLAHPSHVAAFGVLQITVPTGSNLVEHRILGAAQPSHIRSIEIDVVEREVVGNGEVLRGLRRRRRDGLIALVVLG